MPDEDLGEQVCVFVKPVEGADITQDEIVEHMKRFGAGKSLIPACSEIVTNIPLTAAGKADKKVLRQMIIDKYKTINK
jgi:non-ribosomal peptide synthetase component E (peptide arylation enzyme)